MRKTFKLTAIILLPIILYCSLYYALRVTYTGSVHRVADPLIGLTQDKSFVVKNDKIRDLANSFFLPCRLIDRKISKKEFIFEPELHFIIGKVQ